MSLLYNGQIAEIVCNELNEEFWSLGSLDFLVQTLFKYNSGLLKLTMTKQEDDQERKTFNINISRKTGQLRIDLNCHDAEYPDIILTKQPNMTGYWFISHITDLSSLHCHDIAWSMR